MRSIVRRKPPVIRPTTPILDMAKVAAAVAKLTPSEAIRHANPVHDLPPVDHARRRYLRNMHADSCSGFHDPTFLH